MRDLRCHVTKHTCFVKEALGEVGVMRRKEHLIQGSDFWFRLRVWGLRSRVWGG